MIKFKQEKQMLDKDYDVDSILIVAGRTDNVQIESYLATRVP